LRLLVTGAAGFIGSHYVRTLLGGDGAAGWSAASGVPEVTVLDKLTYAGNPANLAPVADSPHYTFVHGDIADARLVDDVIGGHDAVVHFAAETHVDRSIGGSAEFVVTNVLGTQTLLDAALRSGWASSCTSPPTRSTARSRPGRGARTTRSSPTRRTPPQRRAATSSRAPTPAHTGST
jgi:dTDP-glucose 4,6-dehydratase